jgi:antitoxin PrlF
MVALTTMTSKGQLTIPKQVRDQLNLTAGTKFQVTAVDGKIVALPKNRKLADFAGILGRPPTGEVLTIEDMNEAVMDAAAEDDERIARGWNDGRK